MIDLYAKDNGKEEVSRKLEKGRKMCVCARALVEGSPKDSLPAIIPGFPYLCGIRVYCTMGYALKIEREVWDYGHGKRGNSSSTRGGKPSKRRIQSMQSLV